MQGGRIRLLWQALATQAAYSLTVAFCLAADNQSRSTSQIIAQPATGAQRPAARAATLTERLISDARDGRLDDFTFLSAALPASGSETAEDAQKWLAMYEPVRAAILAKLPAGTASDRLQAIHAAAHRFVLTGGYQESCSDLRATFTRGDFNCLTALAVSFDLCNGAGLGVRPILVRGHVLLSYRSADGQRLAYEPSVAEWHVRPIRDSSANRTLSSIELLGKFYYNRGVELLRAGGYRDGLSLLRTSLAFDANDEDARANLVAGLNNWAVEQCNGGRYGDAASLIEQGLALDPNFAPLIANEQLVRTKLAK